MTSYSPLVRGYAALISTLIVCTALTTLAFQVSTSMYLARLSTLEAEHAAVAHARAYSCAQIALFELSANWNYRPKDDGDTFALSANAHCEIESIIALGTQRFVTVRGSNEGLNTTLEIALEAQSILSPPFITLSIREI